MVCICTGLFKSITFKIHLENINFHEVKNCDVVSIRHRTNMESDVQTRNSFWGSRYCGCLLFIPYLLSLLKKKCVTTIKVVVVICFSSLTQNIHVIVIYCVFVWRSQLLCTSCCCSIVLELNSWIDSKVICANYVNQNHVKRYWQSVIHWNLYHSLDVFVWGNVVVFFGGETV